MKRKKQAVSIAVLLLFCTAICAVAYMTQGSVWAKQAVKLNQSELTMAVGEGRTLKLNGVSSKNRSRISWKSSKQNIASVNKKGRVTAKKAGNANITAKYKGKSYKCKISVIPLAVSNQNEDGALTPGTDEYRGFLVDNVYHSKKNGDIHYNVYFPDSYDGQTSYALYVTLPGYQGLYFQGVAENIKTEDFGFEAQKYNSKMIILAPQLDDWGGTSADQTVALTEYFLSHYNIDSSKVYINGYSGGGETLSLVLERRPELFTAALMCSSQWDGAYEPVVEAQTPVYFVIGESDEYYGSQPFQRAYRKLKELYQKQGLSEDEIQKLVVLDVKDKSYFAGTGNTYQHGGGYLFCRDKSIMGWLFRH